MLWLLLESRYRGGAWGGTGGAARGGAPPRGGRGAAAGRSAGQGQMAQMAQPRARAARSRSPRRAAKSPRGRSPGARGRAGAEPFEPFGTGGGGGGGAAAADGAAAGAGVLRENDLGSALVLLFLTNAAFFGTGNIASVSSFELRSVYRFMTTFEPFLMTTLLLAKLALPFVLVSATFGMVCELHRVPRTAVLCIVLLLADVMSVQFFFAVRSEGSWKEIGNSISIFGISNFVMVMIQLLFIATRPAVTGVTLLPAPRP
jgi:hypothetical protein